MTRQKRMRMLAKTLSAAVMGVLFGTASAGSTLAWLVLGVVLLAISTLRRREP